MTKWKANAGSIITLCVVLLASGQAAAAGAAPVDPLDLPAPKAARAAQGPLRAVTQAGRRLVAVGIRGRIVVSDDVGKTWRQASVPVSADLNAVTFADARHGWAVGHDGVILHSRDGGSNWSLQFDGRRLEALITGHYNRAAGAGNVEAANALEEVRSLMQPGPASFFMDVAFEDARHGLAVGKFGLALATQDGGQTWQPAMQRIDNPEFLHLNAIRRIAGTSWIVGEQGSVWRFDSVRQRFQLFQVGYKGGLFGITGNDDFVLTYGLRGNAFRSADDGKRWEPVVTNMAGGIADATMLPGGRVVLASQSGQLAISGEAGRTFQPLAARQPTMYAAVLGLPARQLALVGLNGVRIQQSD